MNEDMAIGIINTVLSTLARSNPLTSRNGRLYESLRRAADLFSSGTGGPAV